MTTLKSRIEKLEERAGMNEKTCLLALVDDSGSIVEYYNTMNRERYLTLPAGASVIDRPIYKSLFDAL